MKNLIALLTILFCALVFTQSFAQDGLDPELTTDVRNTPVKKDGVHLLNVDENGVILKGYDVVAFHTVKKPIKGSAEFQSEYQGAIYYFSSEDNKKTFDANPDKYIPQFGGFCAVAVALNKLSPIQIWTHSIVDGRLVFNHNKRALALWNKNPKGNLKKADKNWPEVSKKTDYSN
ncbi:MAG: YHS domain-containing (seleno)protein [Microscillaceae bacterium]|nr:YHS domain-containing (seleno)protein [Microscillaceae bacterium]